MREPNQEDAVLYLRLCTLKDTAVQAEARAWFFESFDATSLEELDERYPRGSRERHLFAEFLGFYESAGVLVSRGLLHEDVYFDAPFALELVWPRVGAVIDEMREKLDPAAWETLPGSTSATTCGRSRGGGPSSRLSPWSEDPSRQGTVGDASAGWLELSQAAWVRRNRRVLRRQGVERPSCRSGQRVWRAHRSGTFP